MQNRDMLIVGERERYVRTQMWSEREAVEFYGEDTDTGYRSGEICYGVIADGEIVWVTSREY